jgi:hypothetical protein
MSYKQTIYNYVRHANERETDFNLTLDEQLVGDAKYKQLERIRMSRLAAWREQRGAKPIESVTKLTIRERRQTEQTVVADIDMRKAVQIRTNGRIHTEERMESERVVLERRGQDWVIARVEPLVAERYGSGGGGHYASHSLGAPGLGALHGGTGLSPEPVMRSTPYLNEAVLARGSRDAWERAGRYNREAAKDYADRHWNDPSPDFITFDVDCTNYVSQCLYAGGAPMNYTGRRESGWWYSGKSKDKEHWSYSWSVAHAFYWHLMNSRSGLQAIPVSSPRELGIGDVIVYDFDGDGKFQHSTIVTGADGSGMPLVNAHTSNSKARYWDYQDSYAWTERTQYRFFRIRDTF